MRTKGISAFIILKTQCCRVYCVYKTIL